jgi:ADP-ribose pyrophosphatase YjhB (NUDIX family)
MDNVNQITNNSKILPKKTGVGALIVSVNTNRVLLSMRATHKTHSQEWSLFGGMMEEGEQPKEALLRELSEEMNSVPDIERIYPFDLYQNKDKHFKYISFLIVVLDEFIPVLNNENCGYCWINLGNWPRPMHQGARISFCNQRAIERIKMTIAQHPIGV